MTKEIHPFIKYQLPAILWCGVIFALSSIPSKDLPHLKLFPGYDKVIHTGIFFVFCWLAHRAFRHMHKGVLAELSLFLALVATVVYGCSDEFHQLYVIGRSADFYDMLADMTGGTLYALFFILFVRPRNKLTGV